MPSPATTSWSCRSLPPRLPPVGLRNAALEKDEPVRRYPAKPFGIKRARGAFVWAGGGTGICGTIGSAARGRPSILRGGRCSLGYLSQFAGRLEDLVVLATPRGLCHLWARKPIGSRARCFCISFGGPAPLSKAAQAHSGVRSENHHRYERTLVRTDLFVSLRDARGLARFAFLALSLE